MFSGFSLRILFICSLSILGFNSGSANAQGFNSNPITWTSPIGGHYGGFGALLGYNYFSNLVISNGSSQAWNTADINGDGLVDLIVTAEYYAPYTTALQFGVGTNPHWKVYLGNGTGFTTTAITWSTPVGGQYAFSIGSYGYIGTSGFSNQEQDSQTWSLTDMNNDQKPDLVIYTRYVPSISNDQQFNAGTSPYWKVYLNNGSGFNALPINWSTPVGGSYLSSGANVGYLNESGYACSNNANCQSWTLSDFTGDGKPDLVISSQHDVSIGAPVQFGVGVSPYFKVYENTGTSFSSTPLIWNTPVGGKYSVSNVNYGYQTTIGVSYSGSDSSQNWAIGDADGDGLKDLVLCAHYNSSVSAPEQFGTTGSRHWRIHRNTGSGFDPNITYWSTPDGGNYTASGQDLGFTLPLVNGLNFYDSSQTWTATDIDGDHKPELVVMSEYFTVYNCYRQFGVGSNQYWKIYANNDSGFAAVPVIWSTPSGGAVINTGFVQGFVNEVGYSNQYSGSDSYRIADMNGDGKPDLTVFSEYNTSQSYPQQFGVPTAPYWKVYLNNTVPLSIEETVIQNNKLIVYPNPCTAYIKFKTVELLTGATYHLFNVEGKLIRTGAIVDLENIIWTTDLASGVYFVQLSNSPSAATYFIHE